MKKISILSLLLFFVLTGNVFAQSRNVIKVNLFSIAAATLNLSYERALTEKVSAQLGFAYTSIGNSGLGYKGYQIQPEVRFYLSEKEAPAGFYLAPFARYRKFDLTAETSDFFTGTTTEEKASWTSVGGGLVVGGQWLFANEHIAFGVFAGPAFYSHSFKYENNANEALFDVRGGGGFSFRSGVTLGVAF